MARTSDNSKLDTPTARANAPGNRQSGPASRSVNARSDTPGAELFGTRPPLFGERSDPRLKASTRTMNPTVPQRMIDDAMERDAASATAEYTAEFRVNVKVCSPARRSRRLLRSASANVPRLPTSDTRLVGFAGGWGSAAQCSRSVRDGTTSSCSTQFAK